MASDWFKTEIASYEAAARPFYAFLRRGGPNFDRWQYETFRDNYLFRTMNTIPSIARLVLAAARARDHESLCSASQNLHEECGSGKPERNHQVLMFCAFNLHGTALYQLAPASPESVTCSRHLVRGAHHFVIAQNRLYSSAHYIDVVAASAAQESAAEAMLTAIYEGVFLSRQRHYDRKLFTQVRRYFLAHLRGIEHRHGSDARRALVRASRTSGEQVRAQRVASTFLRAQVRLWTELHAELSSASTGKQR